MFFFHENVHNIVIFILQVIQYFSLEKERETPASMIARETQVKKGTNRRCRSSGACGPRWAAGAAWTGDSGEGAYSSNPFARESRKDFDRENWGVFSSQSTSQSSEGTKEGATGLRKILAKCCPPWRCAPRARVRRGQPGGASGPWPSG